MALYPFNEAAGTKLSAIGFALKFGEDCIDATGSGGLQKLASAASTNYYLDETAFSSTVQKLRFVLGSGTAAGSTSLRLGVFMSVGAGNSIHGYRVNKQSGSVLRLMKSVNGTSTTLQDFTVSDFSNSLVLQAEVVGATVEIKLFESGVQIGTTHVDSAADRITSGYCGIFTFSTSAATGNQLAEAETNYGAATAITPDSAVHGHSASSPTISAGGAIAVDSAVHGHSASSPSLAAIGLTLTDIADNRIFQRIGTTASIALNGSYAGAAPADVQARVMQGAVQVLGWTVLTGATIGGGAWSGTLAGVPQGGFYTVEVRSRDGGAVVLATAAGVNQWAVGDLFGVIGSSTADKWFTVGSGSPHALMREYDGGWLPASTTGGAAIAFANQAIADSGVPVGLLDYGVSGATLAQWANNAYSGYTAFAAAMAAVGGKLAGIIVHVGSNDARVEGIPSQATHESRYRTLIANIRTDTGQVGLPVFVMGCARAPLEPSTSDDQWGWARAAEYNVGQDANVYLASTVVDLTMDADNVHLSPDAMVTSAGRVARCAGAVLYGTGLQWRNPMVAGVSRVDDTHSDVTLTHFGGSDFTPASGITGFQISTDDFATVLAISAAARQSATVIRLTHASTGGAAAKVRYQWGATPDIAGAVNDNGAAVRPLGPMPVAIALAAGIAVDSAVHGHAASAPVLSAITPIAVNDAVHGHTASSPLLMVSGTIYPADGLHGHTASQPVLTAQSPIAVDSAVHGHSASAPVLTVAGVIQPASAVHGHVATSPLLTAVSPIAVASATHGHIASVPVLTVPGGGSNAPLPKWRFNAGAAIKRRFAA